MFFINYFIFNILINVYIFNLVCFNILNEMVRFFNLVLLLIILYIILGFLIYIILKLYIGNR